MCSELVKFVRACPSRTDNPFRSNGSSDLHREPADGARSPQDEHAFAGAHPRPLNEREPRREPGNPNGRRLDV